MKGIKRWREKGSEERFKEYIVSKGKGERRQRGFILLPLRPD